MTEQKQELKGYVHSLESFGSVDGPGTDRPYRYEIPYG